MKLATNCVPHMGGTYSWFCRLRAGLAAHGITLRWLAAGSAAAGTTGHSPWTQELASGDVVAPEAKDEAAAARMVVEHLKREQYDGFLINVLCDRLLTNLTRYLPAKLSRVLVVHNISPATYRAARSVRDHVHAAICVAPRVRRDLVARYGFDEDRIFVVPNAVDLDEYRYLAPPRASDSPLKLVFLGRLEDEAKGIFWLPRILAALDDLDITLTVAGSGPDQRRLEAMCAGMGSRVRFLGPVPSGCVPPLLAEHQVLLMPSRFEGFGQVLIEAMAAGCVPVASCIRGVTDTIVRHEHDGFLFPIGDTAAAAQIIRRLAHERPTLAQMSEVARRNVRGRFSIENMAARYADILRQARAAPPRTATPLPLDRWYCPWDLRPGLRTYLPTPVKNNLRLWRERMAAGGYG